jgi:hypothetical protein
MGFALSKPNFCSKCGATTGPISKSSLSKPKVVTEDLLEDETSIDFVPDINRLEFDVEQFDQNVFTLGSLAGEEPENSRVRNRGSKNLEDFINDKRG